MLLAALSFALLDATAKRLVGDLSPLQVAWGRYAFSLVPLLLIVPLRGWRRLATARPGLQFARGLMLIVATAAMFAGLRTLPLADAYALSYVSPVIVAILSRMTFGERLNRRQWGALALGFAGVLVVVRPAFVHAGVAIVFPLLMASSYAAYQVMTRVARRTDDATVCVFYASLVGAALLTLALPLVWRPMSDGAWGFFALMGGLGFAGHWLLAVAFNRAPATLLAPLNYVQLLYAAVLDLAVFGLLPDRWTLAGCATIMIGGILLWRTAATPNGRQQARVVTG
jgi:drug/metabolite transporter (DMT)-like permease